MAQSNRALMSMLAETERLMASIRGTPVAPALDRDALIAAYDQGFLSREELLRQLGCRQVVQANPSGPPAPESDTLRRLDVME